LKPPLTVADDGELLVSIQISNGNGCTGNNSSGFVLNPSAQRGGGDRLLRG
jgi:hypothetical protein